MLIFCVLFPLGLMNLHKLGNGQKVQKSYVIEFLIT
jgi:hypothetical protein